MIMNSISSNPSTIYPKNATIGPADAPSFGLSEYGWSPAISGTSNEFLEVPINSWELENY